jgi:hypothetical protein
MTKLEEIELLKLKLSELKDFRTNLNSKNLTDFKKLITEILSLLTDNHKVRFNQIDFYSEAQEYSELLSDDLPF